MNVSQLQRDIVAKERTLLIVKPDAVEKSVTGKILSRIEGEGFTICELEMTSLTKERAEDFYGVHRDRPFFGELVEFMMSGRIVPCVLEREDAVTHLRNFIGETDSNKAAPNTIRHDFGTDVQCNAVHASDSPENALTEIRFFFG